MDKPDRLEIASDYHTFELLHSIEFKGTSTWDFIYIYRWCQIIEETSQCCWRGVNM